MGDDIAIKKEPGNLEAFQDTDVFQELIDDVGNGLQQPKATVNDAVGGDLVKKMGQKVLPKVISPTQKIRKMPGHRVQKKSLTKPSAMLNQIPRVSLLTPSSSENSLTTCGGNINTVTAADTVKSNTGEKHSTKGKDDHIIQKPNAVATPATPRLPPRLTLQRQRTAAILKFRSRKSISQMDMKEMRRTASLQAPLSIIDTSSALVPLNAAESQREQAVKQQQQDTELMGGMLSQLCVGDLSAFVEHVPDVRVASMRIFNTIMLHVWRKRREEVRQLTFQLEDLKRGSVKNKNQVHVYNSLFRVEQRRNEQLNSQLRRTYQDIANSNRSFEEMSAQFDKLKLQEEVLKEQLVEKFQENEDLAVLLEKSKTELFKTMSIERVTRSELAEAQRELQQQKTEKLELESELSQLQFKFSCLEQKMRTICCEHETEIGAFNLELATYALVNEELDDKIAALKCSEETALQLQQKLHQMQSEVDTLQQCLAATLGNRLKHCVNKSIDYPRSTYQMLHWFAYYVLPATSPPPTPRFSSLGLGLAISKVRAFLNIK